MSFIPRVHEIYKHFKGDLYQITAIAEHTETGETLVVYQAMYGDFKTYARPLEMFVSPVDKNKYPDVTQEFRFELQGPDAERQRRECGTADECRIAVTEQQQEERDVSEPIKTEVPESTAVELCGLEESQEPQLDPLLLQFLDAETYADRLNILAALEHRITDEMITTMAIVCDVEVEEGDVESRFNSLKNCLITLERYECNRLR